MTSERSHALRGVMAVQETCLRDPYGISDVLPKVTASILQRPDGKLTVSFSCSRALRLLLFLLKNYHQRARAGRVIKQGLVQGGFCCNDILQVNCRIH